MMCDCPICCTIREICAVTEGEESAAFAKIVDTVNSLDSVIGGVIESLKMSKKLLLERGVLRESVFRGFPYVSENDVLAKLSYYQQQQNAPEMEQKGVIVVDANTDL